MGLFHMPSHTLGSDSEMLCVARGILVYDRQADERHPSYPWPLVSCCPRCEQLETFEHVLSCHLRLALRLLLVASFGNISRRRKWLTVCLSIYWDDPRGDQTSTRTQNSKLCISHDRSTESRSHRTLSRVFLDRVVAYPRPLLLGRPSHFRSSDMDSCITRDHSAR
jgi:hypothetical protein